jgi:NAD(P) transhydrogenase subunit alpha
VVLVNFSGNIMPTEEPKPDEALAKPPVARSVSEARNERAEPIAPSTDGAVLSVSVPRETRGGELRVALVPELVPRLISAGLEVHVQLGAGAAAGFLDSDYQQQGARLDPDWIGPADVVLKVQPPTPEEIAVLKEGAVLIGLLQPYTNGPGIQALAQRRVTAFALELMPRISRAQAMDVLSAMGTVAGYKAVLLAATRLAKFFPLLMTATGTVKPAQVLIIGAGVAGLQAIATARRLGAVVEAYDTRPAVKEQVESLGAKFVELDLPTQDAEAKTGYAKAQSEEFYRRQRQLMLPHVVGADVVISTAVVPGQRAPVLITEEMVRSMRPGSVIVDLAAEQGGNCELTEPGQEVQRHDVVILAPLNLPSTVPFHASQLYARTVTNFLLHLFKERRVTLDLGDELTRGPLVTHQGEIVSAVVRAGLTTNV